MTPLCLFIPVKCGGSQEIADDAPIPLLTAERVDRLDLKTQFTRLKKLNKKRNHGQRTICGNERVLSPYHTVLMSNGVKGVNILLIYVQISVRTSDHEMVNTPYVVANIYADSNLDGKHGHA